MSYRISMSDPEWTFDPSGIEHGVATLAKDNAVTGAAAWESYIAGLTAETALPALQALLRATTTDSP